jgi:predicted regulator of Ras-like GTPase activity (Roadblock/LC7/MglB family)
MTLVVAIDGDSARQLPIANYTFQLADSERIAAILSTCIAGRGGRVSGTKGHST